MIDLAIVGAGNWGKNLVRVFSSLPGVYLQAVCDTSSDVCKRVVSTYPAVMTHRSLGALLERHPEVDAVVIATHAGAHFALALQALQAGKHVYVEKPLTLQSKEAAILTKKAVEKDLVLMVGHLLLYHPAVTYLKNLVDDIDLGDLLYMYSQRVNLGVVRKQENAWWSLAPHDISVILHMFGDMPTSVTATGHGYLQEGVADVVFANLQFADGRIAHIHVSWLDPHKIRKFTLVGSKAMAVFDDMAGAEKVRVYDKSVATASVENYAETFTLRSGTIVIPHIPGDEPLRAECAHFIDCVANRTVPLTDGKSGADVVRVLEAGAASLDLGGAPVKL